VWKGTQWVVLLFSSAYAIVKGLTTNPSGNGSASQEPNHIRCKVITIKFDKMVRFGTIHVLEGEEVFIECILINLGGSTIDNLDWLAVMRFARYRF